MKKKNIDLSYTDAYLQLRQLVAEIDDDSLQLDMLADKVALAKELITHCEKKLREIEKKLG
jgi:exodeoxyribonuclease VII small subunit